MTFTGHFDGYKTNKTNESFLQSWLLIEIFSSSDNEIQHHKRYIHCCESSYNADAVSNLPRTLQENHLRMLSKMDLRVQMDAKSAQLKNKSNSKLFSSLADA